MTTYYPGTINPAEARVLNVTAGETVPGVEFRLMTDTVYIVSGVVVDDMDRAVSGAMVSLTPATLGPGVVGFPGLSARTQQDGSFRIGGIQAGRYRLMAVIPVVFSSGGNSPASTAPSEGGAGGAIRISNTVRLPSSSAMEVTVDTDVSGVTVRLPSTSR